MKVIISLTLILVFSFACQKAKPYKVTGKYKGTIKITVITNTVYENSTTDVTWETSSKDVNITTKTIEITRLGDEIVFSENNDYRLGIDSLEFNREYTIYHLPENTNQIKMNLVLDKRTVNYTEYNIGLTDSFVDGDVSGVSESSTVIEFSGTK